MLTLLLLTVLIRSSEFSAVAFLLLIMFQKPCVHVGMQMQMCFPVSFVRNDTNVGCRHTQHGLVDQSCFKAHRQYNLWKPALIEFSCSSPADNKQYLTPRWQCLHLMASFVPEAIFSLATPNDIENVLVMYYSWK